MKMKPIVTAMIAAGAFGAIAVSADDTGSSNKHLVSELKAVTDVKLLQSKKVKFKSKTREQMQHQAEYFQKKQHDGKKRYIVRLIDDSVPSYKGDLVGFEAVNKSATKSSFGNEDLNLKSSSARKYATYLTKRQDSLIQKASNKFGRQIPDFKRFKYAINGFVTELTLVEAQKLAAMPEVAFVHLDENAYLETDTGPGFIGAGEVWDGTANGTPYLGEGVIVGILDTGVNTDHVAFAATGDDGYAVINPLGDGVYIGDCVADATLCNSKLIGVRSYTEITDVYSDPIFAGDTRPANGEDYNGHGSHTASTSAGNVLNNVPVVQPESGSTTGDGIPTGVVFPSTSGVAPHANIISYQVCRPGNNGDTYSACPFSVSTAAIEDAIADGVDVLNFSIGHSSDAWGNSVEMGFLSAQAAGIFVATSAGNSGPEPSTTNAAAPWYTSVAASTHGRVIENTIAFDGSNFTYQTSSGPAISADITAPVVYAGDVDAANFEGCSAFAAGSFTSSIALISRGSCAFADKVNNAATAGATAVIVHNNAGDALVNMSGLAATTVSSVFIGQTDGESMVSSLSATPGISATINAVGSIVNGTGDDIASFSSRGPNATVEVISPAVAAPGVSVYAAYSDEQPFMDVTGPSPADYAFLSGTSMASPHVAGAAALLTQAHPTWNPDQIRSALMMTSTRNVRKEDGATSADPHDMGAGRIQVNEAINSGLVMSETEANYLAANPASGGDPKTLNVPSMATFNCAGTCSWTRTFTAVADGSYSLSVSNSAISVEPATLDVVAGQNYPVTVTADVTAMSTGVEFFDSLEMSVTGQPDLHLPIFVRVNNGAVPNAVNVRAGRNDGSWLLEGIRSYPTSDLRISLDGLFDSNATGFTAAVPFEIGVDPTNADYKDDLSVVEVLEFEIAANSVSVTVSISDATSPDFDLYLERDTDGNGNWVNVAGFAGATLGTNETITVNAPEAGNYRAIAQNYESTNATDTGNLNVVVVPQTDPVPGFSLDASTSTDGLSEVEARLLWDLDMAEGDAFHGEVSVSAGEALIGTFPVTFRREADDFTTTTTATLVNRGESIDYTLRVRPSLYNQDQEIEISVDMPANMSLDASSVVASGGNITVKDPNAVGLDLSSPFDIPVDPTNGSYNDDLSQVHVFEFEVPSGTLSMTVSISDSTSPDNDLFVEMDTDGNGSWVNLAGFNGATAATNESLTFGSPTPGMYRAIVQNYASSNATDTGNLNVSTVPATGEGFFLNITSEATPNYTVTSSLTDETCAQAGLGGYADLSFLSTIGAGGDEALWSAFASWTFPFFGENKQGLNFSSNGFINFDGNIGVNGWLNLPIPNSAVPNDMLAGWWRDQIVVDDGVRGIRLAADSGNGLAIVSYDGTQPWTADGLSDDRFTYQILAFDSVSNEHGPYGQYEYIVSFADTQVGNFGGATSGAENSNGSAGVDASSLIQPGSQICFDATHFGQGYEVTFTVTPEAGYLGQDAAPEVTVTSDLPGTSELTVEATRVELTNVAPEANAGADRTYDRGDSDVPSQIVLTGEATLDRDEDHLGYSWLQTSGEDVDLSGSGSIEAFFNINDVPNGSYTFTLTVNDGEFMSSDQITITITGEESGNGSMGLFLLLGLPLLFRRRYSTK